MNIQPQPTMSQSFTIGSTPMQKAQVDPTADYALLYYLRIIFYIIIAIKLVQIVFIRRRKLKISERIQRKFFFAHGIEMINNFSAQEHELMNLTLQNTLKNAIQPLNGNIKKAPSKIKKNVSFFVQSNTYYDPPEARTASTMQKINFELPTVTQIKNTQLDVNTKKPEEQSLPLIHQQSQNIAQNP